jgi:hypothetical protein
MKRMFWAVFSVLLGLAAPAQNAFAGGDFYAGANLYIARTNAPVYDCALRSCETAIRLRQGSYIYAVCWNGGEGWCRIQTKFFKNMFLPRYAIDYAYGYDDYGNKYKDCYYKERYDHGDGYREGCYDKGYSRRKSYGYKDYCYGKSGYAHGSDCTAGYGYKRRYKAYAYSKDEGYGYGRRKGYDSGYGEDEGEYRED